MSNDELMHYGVLEMKKKKKKASYTTSLDSAKANYKSAKKTYNKSFNKAYDHAFAAYSPIKKHRQNNTARWEQVQKDAEALKKAKSAYNKEKKANKQAINKAYNEINKTRSTASKLGFGMYNDATYRKAAKNMVNKGMDQKTAISKAKASAWKNAGIAVAGSFLYANRDKVISGVKKYANAKAIQRANSGLARIGTMKLKHVGQNVYEYVMK